MIAFFPFIFGSLLCDVVGVNPAERIWTCDRVGIYVPPPAMKPVLFIVDEARWDSLPDVVAINGFE